MKFIYIYNSINYIVNVTDPITRLGHRGTAPMNADQLQSWWLCASVWVSAKVFPDHSSVLSVHLFLVFFSPALFADGLF